MIPLGRHTGDPAGVVWRLLVCIESASAPLRPDGRDDHNTMMTFLKLLKDAGAAWIADRATRLGAALAFYSAFSLAPLLLTAITIAAMLYGEQAAQGMLERHLTTIMGKQVAEDVETILASASRSETRQFNTVFGVVLILFSASGVFAQLKDALNTIWQIKARPERGIVRNYLRDRSLSLAMVAVIGFLLLVSLILSTILTSMTEWLGGRFPMLPAIWPAIDLLISVSVITILFAAIFKILPDAKVKWSHVWGGAVLSALLFSLGKFSLGLYLSQGSLLSTYGAASALIVVLLWVYFSALVLLFGAEFTQVYARSRGHAIKPASYAVKVAEVVGEPDDQ